MRNTTVAATERLRSDLRVGRKRKGMNQTQVARYAGVTQKVVSQAESASTDIRLSTFLQIARASDSELVMVPKALVAAVRSLVRQYDGEGDLNPRGLERWEGDPDVR